MKIFTGTNGGFYKAFQRQAESLSSLIRELEKFDHGTESVKLTAAINGQAKRFNLAYVSPLFSDFDEDDLRAIHAYADPCLARSIIEHNVLPELPFLVTILDQSGNDLVTLRCDRDGWIVLKFAASAEHIHSLVKILKRVDALAAGLTVSQESFAA